MAILCGRAVSGVDSCVVWFAFGDDRRAKKMAGTQVVIVRRQKEEDRGAGALNPEFEEDLGTEPRRHRGTEKKVNAKNS